MEFKRKNEDKVDIIDENIDGGMLLRLARTRKKLSLQNAAEYVSVSVNYLSMIERMKKSPSDDIINKLSRLYEIDSNEVFKAFGRVPEKLVEYIAENEKLTNLLIEIADNDKISEDEKDVLYESIAKLYETHTNKN